MNRVAYFQEIKRLRSSGMITLTLTDLLIVVVFVLLLFTFRASEEGRAEISAHEATIQQLQADFSRVHQELAKMQLERDRLKYQLSEQEELVRRLLAETQKPTLPSATGGIPDLEEKNRILVATIEELRKEIEQLQYRLDEERLAHNSDQQQPQSKGLGGTGYPRCPPTAGFLFEIRLLESGKLGITPRWDAADDRNVRSVPGVSELADAREVSLESFNKQAALIKVWGDGQEIPCRFHVDTKTETQSLVTYRQQMSAIDKYFYPTRH